MTPLEIFMAQWHRAIPADVVTYVEAVNFRVDLNDAPDPWAAVIYQPEARPDVTLGSQPWVEESGTFVVGLFTASGKGPAALDEAVAYVRQAFAGFRYGGLLVSQVDGPHDMDPEAVGEWWQVAMTCRYTFQTRRDGRQPYFGDWQDFPDAPPPLLPGP